jgi:molybdate transport system ATP-binding protein
MPAMKTDYSDVVNMKNLTVRYGEHVVVSNINWHISHGEKWALLGPNGSGKSTLLSFIFGDHPQAYSQPLILFDKQRGTGESIWDIKKQIGFTSSEMHLYYRENVSCLKVVASGFFDSIGLFRQCSEEQLQIVEQWFSLLGVSHLMERSFLHISSGEQRFMLFIRALVKNPGLLILDEPFHGLDASRKAICTVIVESFCNQADKTLIYVTHRREEIPVCVTHFMELKK